MADQTNFLVHPAKVVIVHPPFEYRLKLTQTYGVKYPDPMATKPVSVFTRPGRVRRRPRHIAPRLVTRLILVVLALVGVIAIGFLVLGLLNVHAITNHFRIH
jgi:hypothetical protein